MQPYWPIAMAVLLVGCDVPRATGTHASPAADSSTDDAAEPQLPRVVINETGQRMVLIPAGTFLMGRGDTASAADVFDDAAGFEALRRCERPQHRVRMTADFRISQHEVTVRQFRAFVQATQYVTDVERSGLGANGWNSATDQVVKRPDCIWSSPGFPQTDEHPVVCVSWNDAVAYCRWLSSRNSQIYRLPTEAEWEYCCRAGTQTFWETGDAIESLKPAANCGDQALAACCPLLTSAAGWNDGFAFTAPVGSFQPNRFGLHDLHGNVGEWCQDWFQFDYYASSPEVDPPGPATNQQWRVARGGSWYNIPFSCRCCGRHDGVPTAASTTNGFRVVMEIGPTR